MKLWPTSFCTVRDKNVIRTQPEDENVSPGPSKRTFFGTRSYCRPVSCACTYVHDIRLLLNFACLSAESTKYMNSIASENCCDYSILGQKSKYFLMTCSVNFLYRPATWLLLSRLISALSLVDVATLSTSLQSNVKVSHYVCQPAPSNTRRISSLQGAMLTNAYSAFRQKFPKLWTSVAHSFLHQIAQNKSWAHPKATTLPRIYKVEMECASLLFYLAKPQSGGILGCDLRHCTSEPFDSRRFVEACRAYGAYSQYTVWSRCCRCADVRALIMITSVDRLGSVALRSETLCLLFFHLFDFFPHLKM